MAEMSAEILELIRMESNSETKAILLILFKISQLLENNTIITERVVSDLDQHRKDFNDFKTSLKVSKGQSEVWKKVFSWILAFLQAILIASLSILYSAHTDSEHRLSNLEAKISDMHARLQEKK